MKFLARYGMKLPNGEVIFTEKATVTAVDQATAQHIAEYTATSDQSLIDVRPFTF